jgi:hypothetical protein
MHDAEGPEAGQSRWYGSRVYGGVVIALGAGWAVSALRESRWQWPFLGLTLVAVFGPVLWALRGAFKGQE